MTNNSAITNHNDCPGEPTLRVLTVKWAPQILRHTMDGSVRFSGLLKAMPQANKQSVSIALDKLEENGFIERTIVKQKPLHIEYNITERGQSVIQVFKTISLLPPIA